MSEIYYVELPDAPDKVNRFATYPGHEYSGFQCIIFGPKTRVIRKINGVLQGDKPQSKCRMMVDDLRQAVKDGWSQTWLGTARVLKYLGPDQSAIDYEGKVEEAKHVEPVVPKVMLATDGTWRVVPVTGFTKGPREWAYVLAFVDSSTVPRSDRFNGNTKLETITKLFESYIPWHQEYVRTFPLADPADIPAPPAPVVERVYTQAELDAVPPLDPRVWNAMPAEESKRRWAFEPLFREAHRKMEALDKQRQQQEAQRVARETEENDAKRLREEFNKKDADEARKGRGVGTII